MRVGKVVRSFSAKDGRRVVLRTPKWEDLDDLLELINSLVEEGAEIIRDEKVSREEEIDWLSKTLASLEKNEIFLLLKLIGRLLPPLIFTRLEVLRDMLACWA